MHPLTHHFRPLRPQLSRPRFPLKCLLKRHRQSPLRFLLICHPSSLPKCRLKYQRWSRLICHHKRLRKCHPWHRSFFPPMSLRRLHLWSRLRSLLKCRLTCRRMRRPTYPLKCRRWSRLRHHLFRLLPLRPRHVSTFRQSCHLLRCHQKCHRRSQLSYQLRR